MSVVVASFSLEDLFSGKPISVKDGSPIEGQLHLPDYQRPYRWKARELSRLLNDLKDYFDTPEPGHDFYLGSIILHQEEKEGKKLLNIIDGQQRITTMGLLAHCLKKTVPDIKYSAPSSQQRIALNLAWMKNYLAVNQNAIIDFSKINVVLVVTLSADHAYRYFETQNTGGVRLDGDQIIKPHHLRAIADKQKQDDFARLWEEMGSLKYLVDLLMKGRYWNRLKLKELPSSNREPNKYRDHIVKELAVDTSNSSHADISYGVLEKFYENAQNLLGYQDGYAMRQPLNEGVNSIHYINYFHRLYQQLFVITPEHNLQKFRNDYENLVKNSGGSGFLKMFFECSVLLYASQFGFARLHEASLWLFRVCYSPRLSNQLRVTERSPYTFVRDDYAVFDYIASSHNAEECLNYLKDFSYVFNKENLMTKENRMTGGVKSSFVKHIYEVISVVLPATAVDIADQYDEKLQKWIIGRIELPKVQP